MSFNLIIKFESITQQMVDLGVNPHVRDYGGYTQYDEATFSHLNNITPLKSVYFIVKEISSSIAGVTRTGSSRPDSPTSLGRMVRARCWAAS